MTPSATVTDGLTLLAVVKVVTYARDRLRVIKLKGAIEVIFTKKMLLTKNLLLITYLNAPT